MEIEYLKEALIRSDKNLYMIFAKETFSYDD